MFQTTNQIFVGQEILVPLVTSLTAERHQRSLQGPYFAPPVGSRWKGLLQIPYRCVANLGSPTGKLREVHESGPELVGFYWFLTHINLALLDFMVHPGNRQWLPWIHVNSGISKAMVHNTPSRQHPIHPTLWWHWWLIVVTVHSPSHIIYVIFFPLE